MNHLNLEEFERKIAYTFSDKNLLILALTHSSYANETKKGSHENNERLEFLGDAVLDMVVSEYMYRHFPKMPEGELTKLRAAVVCEGSLAELSRKLGVGRCLLLGDLLCPGCFPWGFCSFQKSDRRLQNREYPFFFPSYQRRSRVCLFLR